MLGSASDAPERLSIPAKIVRRLKRGPYSYSSRFGLRRTLSVPVDPPRAKIPLSIRPFQPGDEQALFGHRDPVADPADALEIHYRLQHLRANIPTPYVAIDETTGTPCYLQWLMGSEQNDKIQAHLWGFPRLDKDVALLENAYIPPAYRGQRIMSEAMYMVSERARDLNANYALTFVAGDNMPSLKGCKRAGFDIYIFNERSQYAFGLFERHSFSVIPAGDARLTLLDN
ncbi:N-acetyltransferase [Tabrizicola sp. TH137]|uniref:GNAT family N-acetyltransferase n=1 Tax=Tabrizicola sp. TH137 TaxID=2067452 RepID=UPI000C7CE6AA|nr:GNAT family N-acetyltransferase [Tabrizicola sp. TH137]PLL10667.1 N-acetyltransferase [Tabrizicola sp. TH137]